MERVKLNSEFKGQSTCKVLSAEKGGLVCGPGQRPVWLETEGGECGKNGGWEPLRGQILKGLWLMHLKLIVFIIVR